MLAFNPWACGDSLCMFTRACEPCTHLLGIACCLMMPMLVLRDFELHAPHHFHVCFCQALKRFAMAVKRMHKLDVALGFKVRAHFLNMSARAFKFWFAHVVSCPLHKRIWKQAQGLETNADHCAVYESCAHRPLTKNLIMYKCFNNACKELTCKWLTCTEHEQKA